MAQQEVRQPVQGVCCVWLKHKHRWCSLQPMPGEPCCPTHRQEGSRVACPIDPSHTVKVSRLRKHVMICNRTKEQAAIAGQAWYEAGVNGGGSGPIDTSGQVATASLGEIADATRNLDVSVELEEVGSAHLSPAARNEIQVDRIVAAVEVEGNDLAIVDLGAGRGGLALAALKRWPHSSVLIVERAAPRMKIDARKASNLHRIRSDLLDVKLDAVRLLDNRRLICVAKHLCGAATDLSLKAIVSTSRHVAAVAIATCCHHRCTWADYVGRDDFLQGCTDLRSRAAYFSAAARFSSWCTAPDVRKNGASEPQFPSSPEVEIDQDVRERFDPCAKRLLGRRCKRLIDRGRRDYLRRHGFFAELVPYCAPENTPENVLLLAWR